MASCSADLLHEAPTAALSLASPVMAYSVPLVPNRVDVETGMAHPPTPLLLPSPSLVSRVGLPACSSFPSTFWRLVCLCFYRVLRCFSSSLCSSTFCVERAEGGPGRGSLPGSTAHGDATVRPVPSGNMANCCGARPGHPPWRDARGAPDGILTREPSRAIPPDLSLTAFFSSVVAALWSAAGTSPGEISNADA